MKKNKLLVVLTSVVMVLPLATGTVSAARPPGDAAPSQGKPKLITDNLPNPLAEKRSSLQTAAREMVLRGEAQPIGSNKVVRLPSGQFAELASIDVDRVLTVLGEFGPDTDPYHDGLRPTEPHANHGGAPGPLHNQIAQPDRSVDNTTIWRANFNRSYYDKLLYDLDTWPSMANWYRKASSGAYTVDGYVSPWVQVPFNAANYGSNYCGDIVCQDTWFFVQDSLNAWYQSLLDEGMSENQVNAMLATFDVWDRYDYDGDGDFDEPDGYIDHYQSVHAGMGEEVGGGAQGTDAIWSHRWYNQLTPIGAGGPTVGGEVVPFGGTQIGNSNYWVGDYTVEPENGGVGVFAHEYAHDLDIPDLYDRQGGENSTGWWTVMSQGSYGTQNGKDLGSAPVHFGNWEKFQLGWLDYEVASAGVESTHVLGPAEKQGQRAQGLFVLLPDKEVPLELGDPYEGTQFYYSGSGDDLDNTMTKEVTIPASPGLLTAQARYDTETDWDYWYLTVDDGTGPVNIDTNLSTDTNPNGQNFGNGITGSSGGEWVELTADVSAFAGDTVTIGFRYWTDSAVTNPGVQLDAISIPGQPLDGAESDAGWTFAGWRTTDGSEVQAFFNAYVGEYRQYRGYDRSLREGPYNFGFLDNPALNDWVEHFRYQDGLLLSYWDTSFTDNDVSAHPGGGLILPIDSHPRLLYRPDGQSWRPRVQSYDSTFTLTRTDQITLHINSVPSTLGPKNGHAFFDDMLSWWIAPGEQPDADGWSGVDVPQTGTTIRVISTFGPNNENMRVAVND